MRFAILLIVLLLPLPAGAVVHEITVMNFSFSPKDILVQEGDTVQFNWFSGTHTATSGVFGAVDAGEFFDGPLSSEGNQVEWVVPLGVFTDNQVLPFHCMPHWFAGMTGTITIQVAPAPSQARFDVMVRNHEFDPAQVSLALGDTVRWMWENGAHTTTSGASSNPIHDPGALWNSPITDMNPEFSVVFDSTGTYPYFCIPHEDMDMRGVVVVGGSITGIPEGAGRSVGPGFEFLAPYPNPSIRTHNMQLGLEVPSRVRLDIFDVTGRLIVTVFDGSLPEGPITLRWSGENASGGTVAPGLYFARATVEGAVLVHKLFRVTNGGNTHGH